MHFLLILMATVLLFSTPAGAQSSITVAPGGTIQLSNGTECAPNVQATVFITPAGGTAQRLGDVLVDGRGHFDRAFTVPSSAPEGPAVVQVECGLASEVLSYSVNVSAAAAAGGSSLPLPMIGAGAVALLILGGGAYALNQSKSAKESDDGEAEPANAAADETPVFSMGPAHSAADVSDGANHNDPAEPASQDVYALGGNDVEATTAPTASNDPLADLLPPEVDDIPFVPAHMEAAAAVAPTAPAAEPAVATLPVSTQPEAAPLAPAPWDEPIEPEAVAAPSHWDTPADEPDPFATVEPTTVPFDAAPEAAADEDDADDADYWVWDVQTPGGQRKRVAAVTASTFYLHELTEEAFLETLSNVSDFGPDAALAASFYRFQLVDIDQAGLQGTELVVRLGNTDAPRVVQIELGAEATEVGALLENRVGPLQSDITSPAPVAAAATAESGSDLGIIEMGPAQGA